MPREQVKAEWPEGFIFVRPSAGRRPTLVDEKDLPPFVRAGYEVQRYAPEDTSLLADLEAEVEVAKEVHAVAKEHALHYRATGEHLEAAKQEGVMAAVTEHLDRLQSLIDKHKGGADRG